MMDACATPCTRAGGLTCGDFLNTSFSCVQLNTTLGCDCTGCCPTLNAACNVVNPLSTSIDMTEIYNNTLVFYLVIHPLFWLLPFFLGSVQRRLAARRKKKIDDDTAAASSNRGDDEATTLLALGAAEKAREVLQGHARNLLWNFSWVVAITSLIPYIYACLWLGIGDDVPMVITTYQGTWIYVASGFAPGLVGMILGASPTDVETVRFVCRFFFGTRVFWVLWMIYIETAALSAIDLIQKGYWFGYVIAVGNFGWTLINLVTLIMMWPTLNANPLRSPMVPQCMRVERSTKEKMPTRRKLQRAWFTLRVQFGASVFLFVMWWVAIDFYDMPGPINTSGTGWLTIAISYAIPAFTFTPRNRGRMLRWFSALGKSNSSELEAACVASFLGNVSAATALENATKSFRAVPMRSLTRAHLEKSTPDPSLNALTVPAQLGDVHAFASHSWSDDGSIKYDKMNEWADEVRKAEEVEEVLVWLDKACIDQNNIDASLQALPVFLSGCKSLLVLVGPTYIARLWCIMELFIFIRMGGREEETVVKLLGDSQPLITSLSQLNAENASCFLDYDKQRLLAIIEASFGSVKPFNKIVKELFSNTVGVALAGGSTRRTSLVTQATAIGRASIGRAMNIKTRSPFATSATSATRSMGMELQMIASTDGSDDGSFTGGSFTKLIPTARALAQQDTDEELAPEPEPAVPSVLGRARVADSQPSPRGLMTSPSMAVLEDAGRV